MSWLNMNIKVNLSHMNYLLNCIFPVSFVIRHSISIASSCQFIAWVISISIASSWQFTAIVILLTTNPLIICLASIKSVNLTQCKWVDIGKMMWLTCAKINSNLALVQVTNWINYFLLYIALRLIGLFPIRQYICKEESTIKPCGYFMLYTVPWASIHWAVTRLTAKSRKVSKLRDWILQWLRRSEIWQASRQGCCPGACQISERL